MFKTIRSWWQDNLLRGVLKNTSYLFSSNTLAAALSMINSIFVTRLLGITGLGVVTTVQTFTSNINRFLSFRMSEVVVKYLGQALANDLEIDGENKISTEGATHPPHRDQQASAFVKGIGLIEAGTSILAYLILVLLSPWAARVFLKDPSLAALFPIYGLVLLANLVYETSVGVLQTHKRFSWLGTINTIQSIITAILILLAFMLKRSILDVLGAYLLAKSFSGIFIAILAFRQMNKSFGYQWWHASFRLVKDWRSIFGFAINTNLNGTVNLITRDNAPLYLAALSPADVTTAYVGYFKLGLSIINLITLPIDPFIWPTYAEITRTIALHQWQKTRGLLKQVSAIAAAWTFTAAAGIAVFGWWLIPFLYGPTALPAYPVVLILLIGYGIANTFNWNRPLMLALGKPSYPLLIALGVGMIEFLLILSLVPTGGYLVMSAILSAYLAISVGMIAWKGWRLIKHNEFLDQKPQGTVSEDSSA
jgi:O-antigen/teichoic acid export membrane protein